MIPLVMIFLFIVVPIVLFCATLIFTYHYFKKKKYHNNPHYQEFEKTVLPIFRSIFKKKSPSSEKPSDAVVDVEFKNIDNDKLEK
ncbi:MAG TPA: hypothetical protein DD381_13695 [Lentisphaeria bacterium]|nr:MAG: hypothetical protein A2X47_03780 [Lentisphaerae bacterium GWF2_38_69]HBM17375.1 hypothetical protein [Lentisphaeria bacterium]